MDSRISLIATQTHSGELVARAQRERGGRPSRSRRAARLRRRARTAAPAAAGRPVANCG